MRELSTAEVLETARSRGFAPTKRLLTDWVSHGLLDQPRRRGLGRGRGTEVVWAEEQMNLLLVLLGKRKDVKRIAPLCNIPVWTWLWFGEQFVPLRQARRALETWTGAGERADSWKQARSSARELVSRFADQRASRASREHLADLIARTAYGRPFDRHEVLAAFRRVFDPIGDRAEIGFPGFTFRPESYVFLIETRISALAGLRGQLFDDAAFLWAQRAYLENRVEYSALVPRIAEHTETAGVFLRQTDAGVVLPPTLEDIVNHACADLLTLLGIHAHLGSRGAAVGGE